MENVQPAFAVWSEETGEEELDLACDARSNKFMIFFDFANDGVLAEQAMSLKVNY